MSKKFDADKWQWKIKEFCSARDWDQFHTPKDLAIGLVTEASELLEHFRFATPDQEKRWLEEKREEVGEELADSLFFILRFCQKYNFNLQEIMESKIQKNELKYSVEKSKGQNKKSTEL